MKIHSITVTNLASLKGSYTIDFTRQPLQDCGLFAITGPTGAGKTTLLDALTLSLYGEVAREAHVDGVMSYGSGECHAEVIFETAKGTFKAKWARQRARRRPDGRLQSVNREVACWPAIEGGEIFTGRDVDGKINEVLGLTKEQFLKSVLLAQGDFTAFLKAKDKERADLLEKMTSTEAYREISRKAYRKWKEEEALEATMRLQMGAIQLFSEEEEIQKGEVLKEANALQEADQKEKAVLDKEMTWLFGTEKLQQIYENAQKVHQQAALRIEQEQENIRKWENHQQAVGFEIAINKWQSLQEEIAGLNNELAKLADEIENLQSKSEVLDKTKTEAETIYQSASEQLEMEKLGLQQAIGEQRALEAKRSQLLQLNDDLQKKGQELKDAEQRLEDYQKEIQDNEEKSTTLQQWLHLHKTDENLASAITECQEKLQELVGLNERMRWVQQLLQVQRASKDKTEKEYDDNIRKTKESDDGLTALLKQEAELEAQISQWHYLLLEQSATMKAEAEQLGQHLDEIAEAIPTKEFFLNHYNNLKEGQPCPLCGSEAHPYEGRDVSGLKKELQDLKKRKEEAVEKIRTHQQQTTANERLLALLAAHPTAENYPDNLLQGDVTQHQQLIQNLIDQWQSIPAKRSVFSTEKSAAEVAITQATEQIQKADEAIKASEEKEYLFVDEGKNIYRFFENAATKFSANYTLKQESTFIKLLEDRVSTFTKQRVVYDKLDIITAKLKEQEKDVGTSIENLKMEVQAKRDNAGRLFENINRKSEEISRTYPATFSSPEAYFKHLEDTEKSARQQFAVASTAYSENEQKLTINNALETSKKATFTNKQADFDTTDKSLLTDIAQAGLPGDILTVAGRLLDTSVRVSTQQLVENIYQQLHNAAQREMDCVKSLNEHKELALTESTKEQVEIEIDRLNKIITERDQLIGALKQEFAANQKAKTHLASLQEQIDKQHKEVLRWADLANLIGSAEGDKFARFAQAISLGQLLVLANAHLDKLSDRYRLCCSKVSGEELKLLVVDNYQAGWTRDTKTLSGGESFLVSLGLALGLADMASQNTRIDSLFIDEGFGTLDEAALDDAITTLEGLQARGKTIGVISHIEQLKDRIQTQVIVRKQGSGFSTLEVSPMFN